MIGAPPLRFIGAVVGGWICIRVTMLAPPWDRAADEVEPVPERRAALVASAQPPIDPPPAPPKAVLSVVSVQPAGPGAASAALPRAAAPIMAMVLEVPHTSDTAFRADSLPAGGSAAVIQPPFGIPTMPRREDVRWSGSAWAFVRRGSEPQLAAGGTLGGSQIGGRLSYRINDDPLRPLSLSARAYAPLADMEAAEVAVGVEWQPLPKVPLRLLAERRQATGGRGRSDFGLMAYGGINDKVGPARFEAYAQAGVVGVGSRDLFADGAAALRLPIDRASRIEAGAGAWAAAQPGVARVDVGPQLSIRLPMGTRLNAEWRVRIAGKASPASGPALTLATDF